MPVKNSLKTYVEDGYYHLYNRGINKAEIFNNSQDYGVFLSYLKNYLLPKDEKKLFIMLQSKNNSFSEKDTALKLLRLENYFDRIQLIAYCLMPNHFHMLVHQTNRDDIQFFMKSLLTRFVKYINQKYKRTGPLFEGRYKAVLIQSDEQLVFLSRYIHRNPIGNNSNILYNDELQKILTNKPSSYDNYLHKVKQSWVKPAIILSHFSDKGFNSYQSFVEDTALEERSKGIIYDAMLDNL